MDCNCAKYSPITLDRTAIKRQIKDSPGILKSLTPTAHHPELEVTLFACPTCGQSWQDGFEWNFGNARYVFQVPEIETQEWLTTPYAQPAAMMIYSAVMEDFFKKNTFEATSSICGAEGCAEYSVKFSRFCRDHHIESLQRSRLLVKPPIGRLFPPYYVSA